MKRFFTSIFVGILTAGLCCACQSADPVETKPQPAEPTTVLVEATQSMEPTTQEPSQEEVRTLEVTLEPLESSAEETSEEAFASTEEIPPMTRDRGELLQRIEYAIYDHVYCYEDTQLNFHVHFIVPQVYTKDQEKFKEINDTIVKYAQANFETVYALEDIRIEYRYQAMTESVAVLSYLYTGDVTHLDTNDGQFFEKDRTLHTFTMERTTGKIYSIEEVYGMERVVNDITAGDYRVVEGNPLVFGAFTNEQLATMYRDYNTVPKDLNHEQDFYIKDGHVTVIIWVGHTYDNYVRLELKGDLTIPLS